MVPTEDIIATSNITVNLPPGYIPEPLLPSNDAPVPPALPLGGFASLRSAVDYLTRSDRDITHLSDLSPSVMQSLVAQLAEAEQDLHEPVDELSGTQCLEYLRRHLSKRHESFLFVNGDLLGGSQLATVYKGESVISILNQLQPTLVAIGNHEFDFHNDQLERCIAESAFPWLGENITWDRPPECHDQTCTAASAASTTSDSAPAPTQPDSAAARVSDATSLELQTPRGPAHLRGVGTCVVYDVLVSRSGQVITKYRNLSVELAAALMAREGWHGGDGSASLYGDYMEELRTMGLLAADNAADTPVDVTTAVTSGAIGSSDAVMGASMRTRAASPTSMAAPSAASSRVLAVAPSALRAGRSSGGLELSPAQVYLGQGPALHGDPASGTELPTAADHGAEGLLGMLDRAHHRFAAEVVREYQRVQREDMQAASAEGEADSTAAGETRRRLGLQSRVGGCVAEEDEAAAVDGVSPLSADCVPADTAACAGTDDYYIVRVGTFTVCTAFTPALSYPSPGTHFADPVQKAEVLAHLLRAVGCHYVVCASHVSVQEDVKIAAADKAYRQWALEHMGRSGVAAFADAADGAAEAGASASKATSACASERDAISLAGLSFPLSPSLVTASDRCLIDVVVGGHEHVPIVVQAGDEERAKQQRKEEQQRQAASSASHAEAKVEAKTDVKANMKADAKAEELPGVPLPLTGMRGVVGLNPLNDAVGRTGMPDRHDPGAVPVSASVGPLAGVDVPEVLGQDEAVVAAALPVSVAALGGLNEDSDEDATAARSSDTAVSSPSAGDSEDDGGYVASSTTVCVHLTPRMSPAISAGAAPPDVGLLVGPPAPLSRTGSCSDPSLPAPMHEVRAVLTTSKRGVAVVEVGEQTEGHSGPGAYARAQSLRRTRTGEGLSTSTTPSATAVSTAAPSSKRVSEAPAAASVPAPALEDEEDEYVLTTYGGGVASGSALSSLALHPQNAPYDARRGALVVKAGTNAQYVGVLDVAVAVPLHDESAVQDTLPQGILARSLSAFAAHSVASPGEWAGDAAWIRSLSQRWEAHSDVGTLAVEAAGSAAPLTVPVLASAASHTQSAPQGATASGTASAGATGPSASSATPRAPQAKAASAALSAVSPVDPAEPSASITPGSLTPAVSNVAAPAPLSPATSTSGAPCTPPTDANQHTTTAVGPGSPSAPRHPAVQIDIPPSPLTAHTSVARPLSPSALQRTPSLAPPSSTHAHPRARRVRTRSLWARTQAVLARDPCYRRVLQWGCLLRGEHVSVVDPVIRVREALPLSHSSLPAAACPMSSLPPEGSPAGSNSPRPPASNATAANSNACRAPAVTLLPLCRTRTRARPTSSSAAPPILPPPALLYQGHVAVDSRAFALAYLRTLARAHGRAAATAAHARRKSISHTHAESATSSPATEAVVDAEAPRVRLFFPRAILTCPRLRFVPNISVAKVLGPSSSSSTSTSPSTLPSATTTSDPNADTKSAEPFTPALSLLPPPTAPTGPPAAPLSSRDPASLSSLATLRFPPHAPTAATIAYFLTRLFASLTTRVPLHAPVCKLASPLDTRTEFTRTRGRVSGPNMMADAFEHWAGPLLSLTRAGAVSFGDSNSNVDTDAGGNPFLTGDTNGRAIAEPAAFSAHRHRLLTTQRPAGQLSIINGGFLRGDMLYPRETVITYASILEELPFQKHCVFMLMLGRDIVDGINEELVKVPKPSGAFPHFSRNVRVEFAEEERPNALVFPKWELAPSTAAAGAQECVRVSSALPTLEEASTYIGAKRVPRRVRRMWVDGVPVQADAVYLVTTTQFIAWGGDGCDSFKRGLLITHPMPERNNVIISMVLYEYLSHLAKQHKLARSKDATTTPVAVSGACGACQPCACDCGSAAASRGVLEGGKECKTPVAGDAAAAADADAQDLFAYSPPFDERIKVVVE